MGDIMRILTGIIGLAWFSGVASAGTITIRPGDFIDLNVDEPTTVYCSGSSRPQNFCTCDVITSFQTNLTYHRFINGVESESRLETYSIDTNGANLRACNAAAFQAGGAWYDSCRLRSDF
jgi:hypothetical protein